MIADCGRMVWQKASGYNLRAKVETTTGRHKSLIGPWLHACGFAAQQTEAVIGGTVLNRILVAGRPDTVRRQRITG